MERFQATQVALRPPVTRDAKIIWTLARNSEIVDSNPAYFYLLWCHEFANTSIVATVDDQVMAFLLGYLRQDLPDTLVVWQAGVDPAYRVFGLRLRMLNEVIDRNVDRGVHFFETTVTRDDKAIIRVVERFARQRAARVVKQILFDADHFPDEHAAEILYCVGPLPVDRRSRSGRWTQRE